MEQNKQGVNMPADVKPIFADDVNVNANIKVNVEKKDNGEEKFTKSGRIDLLFFDQFTKTIVSRVVIDPYTAKVFAKILEANASKMIEEIERSELPDEVKERMKQQKQQIENQAFSTSHTYIG
jgi:hypothetical protein